MMSRPVSEMSVDQRIAALQAAADEGRWDAFGEVIRTWAGQQPENPWLQAGLAVAAAACGEDTSEAQEGISALDARLAEQVALVADLRGGDRAEAGPKIIREIASGNRDPALMGAYRWVEPGLDEPVKHLFSTPHLVAGCVLQDRRIASMAAKGSRMSADSLGHRTDQIWSDVGRLSGRVNIGIVRSIEVLGEDGGWVLASSGDDPPRLVTALVAVSSVVPEASARAEAVVAAMEAGP